MSTVKSTPLGGKMLCLTLKSTFQCPREGPLSRTIHFQSQRRCTAPRSAENSRAFSFSSTSSFALGTAALAAAPSLSTALSEKLGGFGDGDPLSLATALGLLTLIVAVHECGHFLAARLQNIHVSKFSIGFGPILARYQSKNVEYSIRAIPLGGFVAFPDDDPNSPYPEDDPNLLRNRPIPDRAVVICAGVVANLLFAYSILLAQVSYVGVTNEILQPGVVIPRVLKQSAAEKAGILPGDVILAIDGMKAAPNPETVNTIVDVISSHANRELTLEIERNGKMQTMDVVPSIGADGMGQLGVQLVAKRKLSRTKATDPINAVQLANLEFSRLSNEVLMGLKSLFFDFSKSANRVSGPIAVIAMGAQVVKLNASQLYLFAAIVNINLAVVNILPLPALDGGYLALLVLEALRGGKKLPQNVEQGVMASGVLFLVALGCILVVRDTVNLGLL